MGIGSVLAGAAMLAAASAPQPMQGCYHYSFNGGRNAGGDVMAVDYDLSINRGCRLVMAGYQTDETILCTVKPAAKGVAVQFKSYGDGRVVNAYGIAIYKPGQELIRVARRGPKLVTEWTGLLLPDNRRRPPGQYFKRERCAR